MHCPILIQLQANFVSRISFALVHFSCDEIFRVFFTTLNQSAGVHETQPHNRATKNSIFFAHDYGRAHYASSLSLAMCLTVCMIFCTDEQLLESDVMWNISWRFGLVCGSQLSHAIKVRKSVANSNQFEQKARHSRRMDSSIRIAASIDEDSQWALSNNLAVTKQNVRISNAWRVEMTRTNLNVSLTES